MSLTVKAYLKRSGVGNDEFEIRRFAVDQDVSTNYNYLVGKITSVFQGLANKSILLHWKDAEKDAITFSSDEELIEALGFVTDGVFKVYIEEKAPPVSLGEPHADCGVLHHGVVCDGCEGPVYGTRHKCSVCPDYDLCMGCKSTGLHSEHAMIPIEHPARRHDFMMGMPRMMLPHPGMMPHHPGMMPHPGRMPPHQGMIPPHQGMMPPPYGCPPCSFAPGASGPNPPFFGQNQTASPEEHRNMRRAWRRWWRTTYAEPWKKCKKEKKEEKKREKKERKEKKKAEKLAEGGAARAENKSSSSSSSDEGEASPNGDYLKSVGESVAAMLDPLGIDVEVDVEHRGQRRRCHRGGHHHGSPWGFGMHGYCGGPSWGFRGGRGGHCPWRPTPSTPSEPMPQPQQTKPAGPPQENRRDVDTNSKTGEIASGVQTPMASGNFSKANDVLEGNGWTFIPPTDNLEEEVEGATRGVEQLNVSTEAPPQYVPVSGDYPNADPLVQAAVADMQRMGFSDDGGWLTALLTAYGGDIGRALDAINAKK